MRQVDSGLHCSSHHLHSVQQGNVAGIFWVRESLHTPIPFQLNMLFLEFRRCLLPEQVFFAQEPHPCLHPAHPPQLGAVVKGAKPCEALGVYRAIPMDGYLGDQGWCQV